MYISKELLQSIESLLPYNKELTKEFLRAHFYEIENADENVDLMMQEFELTRFDAMSLQDLFDSLILIAAQNIQNDINFDKVATRLYLTDTYRKALEIRDEDTDFASIYKRNFKNYIHKGIQIGLLNPELANIFDLDMLAEKLIIELDDNYNYIGISTLRQRYGLHDRKDVIMETPQFTWMRVAMGLALLESKPDEYAFKFYEKLAKKEYIPGGSTNIGSGTTFSVLSNCYLIDTEDDIHAIYDNVKHIAMISKATGGIGISVTKLRSAGSRVESNNTISTGPIPFIKVMDTALKSMSRGGKKYGAMCIYMENWHLDVLDFIDLRQNNGDDYRRIRTADTAVYISDEFMKRVIGDEQWYLFNPQETNDLPELYGQEFSKRYAEYCEMAEKGELKKFLKMPARELMKKMLTSLMSTSHPWLTWKDPINVRALNNNTGTIHSSNLCTEITLPQDRDNIAVCNLAYVNLKEHVIAGEQSIEQQIDWNKLEDTVRVLMRHLDNLIDVNELPIKEAKKSDSENRAVGMGMSGFSESLELLGLAYDSKGAYDLMDRVTEFISYISIDESCNLAEERGSYSHFEGSLWSKGYVPIDTVKKLAQERQGQVWDESIIDDTGSNENTSIAKTGIDNTLTEIKTRIESGLENSTSKESKDLYEIFGQLTQLIQNSVGTDNEKVEEKEDKNQEYFVENEAGEGIELKQSMSYAMDWERLRERVKKGMRNATTMAIAPNASTGLVLGTSPGIDPRFAQIFSRQTSNGKFLDINHNLVKDLKALNIWEDVKDQVLQNYGDISGIDEIPEDLKAVYKTSFQVSPYAFIEVASRAQKWIDQAISRNMYLDTRDVDKLVDIYTEAWRRGLKTTYYLHVKPRHQSEQTTVKVNKRESMNRKGFGTVGQTMEVKAHIEKPSEETSVEKTGFAFVKYENNKEVEQEKAEEKKEEKKSSGGGFGFGKLMSKVKREVSIDDRANLKPEKKTIQFNGVCPIDPAERAMCEACQ